MGDQTEMTQAQPADHHESQPDRKSGRTFALKTLIVGFLLISAVGWLRLEQAAANWKWIEAAFPGTPPLYLAISGGAWGAMNLAAGLGLWVNIKPAAMIARISIVGMAAWFWVERVALTNSPVGWANLPFTACSTVAMLAYVFIVLSLRGQKEYFAKNR
jgi:FtsH-binding integral membrane protein